MADILGGIALNDPHPLIRAKALVAWGRHSGADDVLVAEAFLGAAGPTWRPYAFVAAQEKTPAIRDDLYDRWGGSAKGLSRIAQELRAGPIKWTRL